MGLNYHCLLIQSQKNTIVEKYTSSGRCKSPRFFSVRKELNDNNEMSDSVRAWRRYTYEDLFILALNKTKLHKRFPNKPNPQIVKVTIEEVRNCAVSGSDILTHVGFQFVSQ